MNQASPALAGEGLVVRITLASAECRGKARARGTLVP